MDLDVILRESLIFNDYQKVKEILKEYKLEDLIQKWVDRNNKELEDYEYDISNLEDQVDDKDREIEGMQGKLDEIQEILEDEEDIKGKTKEELVVEILDIIER